MPRTTLLVRFLGCGNTSQQNNALARYVRFAELCPHFKEIINPDVQMLQLKGKT